MSVIQITGKLTAEARARLDRVAGQFEDLATNPYYAEKAFERVGYKAYRPGVGELHAVARHMMVVAGTTFTYEVVE